MEHMLRILCAHGVNFSVEFFPGSGYTKVRVRKTQAWDENQLWESGVLRELKETGYEHCGLKMLKGASLATPTAVIEYQFAPGE